MPEREPHEPGQEEEKSFSPETALADSKKFFEEHGLSEFAEALPEDILLSESQIECILEAQKKGLDRSIMLPPISVQEANIEKLIAKTAGKIEPDKIGECGYKVDAHVPPEQVKEPIAKHSRPKKNPYLLLYPSNPLDVAGKVNSPIEDVYIHQAHFPFSAYIHRPDHIYGDNIYSSGLTLPEYFVAQRMEYENTGNHEFSGESGRELLLLDARRNKKDKPPLGLHPGERYFGDMVTAKWDTESQGIGISAWVNVQYIRGNHLTPCPTIVLELEQKKQK